VPYQITCSAMSYGDIKAVLDCVHWGVKVGKGVAKVKTSLAVAGAQLLTREGLKTAAKTTGWIFATEIAGNIAFHYMSKGAQRLDVSTLWDYLFAQKRVGQEKTPLGQFFKQRGWFAESAEFHMYSLKKMDDGQYYSIVVPTTVIVERTDDGYFQASMILSPPGKTLKTYKSSHNIRWHQSEDESHWRYDMWDKRPTSLSKVADTYHGRILARQMQRGRR